MPLSGGSLSANDNKVLLGGGRGLQPLAAPDFSTNSSGGGAVVVAASGSANTATVDGTTTNANAIKLIKNNDDSSNTFNNHNYSTVNNGKDSGHKRRRPTTKPVTPTTGSSTTTTTAAAITIDIEQQQPSMTPAASQPPHQQRAVSATSCASDESEESVPDSWEEGRAPLLRRSPHSLADDGLLPTTVDHRAAGGAEDASAADATDTGDAVSPKSRRRIPRDRHKTGYAFLMLVFAGTLNDIVLSYIHELVPETPPLPDIAFAYLPYWPWALVVSECLMISSFVVMLTIAILHKYRWVVLRRIFLIGALLYLGRCVTMLVTQVPVADPNYYCSPRLKPEQRTLWNIVARALSVLVGLGLKINGRHTLCGDYIYSGHTIVHVTCYLFIREYSPRRWRLLHFVAFSLASIGVLSLLFSRGHYSIDVIVAYWVTTRLFWMYHTLADLPALRNELQGRNHLTKTVWYRLFLWMESGVQRQIPRKYELPFTIPTQLRRCWRRRRSTNGTTHENVRDRLIE